MQSEKEGTESTISKLTRRGFVATLATAAGTAALAGNFGCSPKEPSTEIATVPQEEIYQGICRGNCGGGCGMNVHVREGKIVKTSVIELEDPLSTRICQRGLTHALRVYAPNRIKYPMRRKEGSARGAGEWEQLSWDDAIAYVADKWKGYINQYGGSSIVHTLGAGSYTHEQYYWMRLEGAIGTSNCWTGYDQNGLYTLAQTVTRGLYLHGNSPNSILEAKYIFMICQNGTVAEQVRWAQNQSAILDHGAELIVIDPNFTGAASKANQFVPIKPGTDAVLLMAMTNVIIEEGLQDDEYLARGSVAPFLAKSDGKYLRLSDLGIEPTEGPADPRTGQPTVIDPIAVIGQDGEPGDASAIQDPQLTGTFTVNGIEVTTVYTLLRERIAEWTPERASQMCDIPVETIRELARKYAEGPSTLYMGWGVDHWANGYSFYQVATALAAVAGQFGKPGTGFQGSCGGSFMGAGGNIGALMAFEGYKAGPTFPVQVLNQVINAGKVGDIDCTPKSLLVLYSNPLTCAPDRNGLIEAFDKLDLIVVIDSVMNDTTRYADVILPVPHWFEFKTAILSNMPFARISEQAIAPLYDTKPDIDIINLLADAMGFGDICNMDTDAYFTSQFDNPTAEAAGLSWEALQKEKSIRVGADTYIFGENFTLPTPTGRMEFYFETVKPQHLYGQDLDFDLWKLPNWTPPLEAWEDNPLFEKYPLTIMSHRDKFKVHSTFSLTPWLEELNPEPTLNINPVDAESRGIADGDYVRVFNDRGYVVLKAHWHAGIRPGVVDTEHTWYQERYREGHYQAVTSPVLGGYADSTCHFDTLCQVEKA
jgi:molybdopterin-containing oxidoreductase family molybdopterin binding subunit